MTNQPTLEDILRARGETIEQRRQREAHGTLDPELIYALRRETEPQREARLERYRQEDSALRVAQATAPTVPVDWEWANARRTLPIFSAVALSLGHDIEALAPLRQKWRNRPFVEPPKDYALRVTVTYEAVRDGTLKSHSTSQAGAPFDVNADFADAQCWEISLLEFRHFCDAMGWRTPAEFRPTGYAPTGDAAAPAESSASTRPDYSMLATRAQLIQAFGAFTGMDLTWFRNLKDTPALLNARKVTGQGGRGHLAEPWFCPFEVMQWLASGKRKKGRPLSLEKAWELLERDFPKVHSAHSAADPRAGD